MHRKYFVTHYMFDDETTARHRSKPLMLETVRKMWKHQMHQSEAEADAFWLGNDTVANTKAKRDHSNDTIASTSTGSTISTSSYS